MARASDIQGNGALIAGDSVDLKVTGSLTNKDGATVAGRELLKIDAGSIDVLNGARIHATDVDLKTKEDLDVIGASVTADNSLVANAGRDLNVKSTTRSDSSTGVGYSRSNCSWTAMCSMDFCRCSRTSALSQAFSFFRNATSRCSELKLSF